MKKLLFLVLSILSSPAYTQSYDPAYPHVAVMTPESSALAKYADIPVSYFTGVPNISIPLYTIQLDNFELPITLSYNSSGIRADQEATWVGLGWTLNAGGRISRTVKFVDDFLNGGSDDAHPLCSQGYYFAPDIAGNDDALYTTINYAGNNGVWIQSMKVQSKDSEPDVFYYSLPSYTGKFILDKSRGAVLFDKSHNLRIEVLQETGANPVNFRITAPDGTRYYFSMKEYSRCYMANSSLYQNTITTNTQYDDNENNYTSWSYIRYPDGGGSMFPTYVSPYRTASCWCLTKITTRTGKEINFSYVYENQSLPAQESSEIYNSHNYRRKFFYKSKVTNENLRLSAITWDFGSIVFNSSDREDIKGTCKKLSNIVVKDKNNTPVKEYDFSYSYFNDNYSGSSQYKHVFKRLKLLSVTEAMSGEQHQFDYYAGTMPAKNTKNVDYWGLPNGREYGDNYCVGIFLPNNIKYNGVTKESSFSNAVVGQLKEITYPTGGYARFTYELNSFSPTFCWLTNNDGATDGSSGSSTLQERHLWVGNHIDQYPNMPLEASDTIQINTLMYLSITGHLENTVGTGDPNYHYDDTDFPIATLKKISPSSADIASYKCPYVYEGYLTHQGEGLEATINGGTFSLSPGTYVFKANRPPLYVMAGWYLKLDYQSPLLLAGSNEERGGGLRISKIETNNSTRTFIYPTGTLMTAPTLYYHGNRVGDGTDTQNGYSTEECTVQVSESKTPMSSFNHGNAVGYAYVDELLTSDNRTIRTRHYYHCEQEEKVDDDAHFSFSPVTINYMNGLPQRTEYYDNNHKIKSEEYTYISTSSSNVQAFIDRSGQNRYGDVLHYSYQVAWPKMSQKTITYQPVGCAAMTDTYSYEYNNFDQMSQSIHIVEDKTYREYFKYPSDYSDAISQAMTRNNIISSPVETYKYLNGMVYEAVRYVHGDSLQWFLPTMFQTIHAESGFHISSYSNRYHTDVQYDRYSEKGNILQMTEKGVCTSYIWSYNWQYPVAVVKGATYAQIETALGGSTAVRNFSASMPSSATTVRQFLAPLIAGPSASGWLTTIYTYKPLVGITSVTNPNGQILYYEYDQAGRLYQSKDSYGQVLRRYDYHYAE